MEKYWEAALSFAQYMDVAQQRYDQSAETSDEFEEYYKLGLHRMERVLKQFKPDEQKLQALQQKNFQGKLLVISEPWCGDASATVPAVAKFFEAAGTEVRIFLRDSDTTLIDQFLTEGTQSIPKILILNDQFEVIKTWGPRPAYGTELLKKFKAADGAYAREDFYNDLQVYYAKNRGADAISEIVDLLP